jgi:hypothetical protein
MVRVLQWVDVGGVVAVVARTISSTFPCGMVGLPPPTRADVAEIPQPFLGKPGSPLGYTRRQGANHCGDSIRGHTLGGKKKSFSPLDFTMTRGLRFRDRNKHGTLSGRDRQSGSRVASLNYLTFVASLPHKAT